MIWILIYWIICGLITFSLINPDTFIFTFPADEIGELILSMLLGGLIIPILLIVGVYYIVKLLITGEDE